MTTSDDHAPHSSGLGVIPHYGESDDAFQAFCSCGWTGPERDTEAEAQADVDQHIRENQS